VSRNKYQVLRRLLVAAACLAAPALGVTAASPTPAAAHRQPHLVPGRGAWLAGHTDFVGFYRAQVGGKWVKVYCVRPGSQAPSRIRLHTVSRLPATSAAVSRQLAETLTAHGNARTAVEAEAVSQALNAEIGNRAAVARRARYLPARARTLAERYLAEARDRRGPYRLAIHLRSSPLPGRAATGAVTLRSASGAAPGTVILRHTANVQTPKRLQLGRSGRTRFTYRTVGGGPVHLTASARVIPTTLRTSRPSARTQLMLSWSPRATARAHATYQGSGPGIAHRYACSSQCDGHPRVTLTACAPANRYRSRITFWFGDQTRRIVFPPASAKACRSWNVTIADGTQVSATWQFHTATGWTRPVPAAGSFTVACPAAPPVAVILSYDCTAATVSAVLGTQHGGVLSPLHNRTSHRMVLVLGGAASGRFALAPGAAATAHTFSVSCDAPATISVRGGVQRTDGSYNYADPMEITMP